MRELLLDIRNRAGGLDSLARQQIDGISAQTAIL